LIYISYHGSANNSSDISEPTHIVTMLFSVHHYVSHSATDAHTMLHISTANHSARASHSLQSAR